MSRGPSRPSDGNIPSWMSGESIELVCGNVSFVVVVERVMSERALRAPEGTHTLSVRIALPHKPYGRLHVRDYLHGVVDFMGSSEEKTAVWVVTNPASSRTRLESTVRKQQRSKEKGSPEIRFQLAVRQGDELVASRIVVREDACEACTCSTTGTTLTTTTTTTESDQTDETVWRVRTVDLDSSSVSIDHWSLPVAIVNKNNNNNNNDNDNNKTNNSMDLSTKAAPVSCAPATSAAPTVPAASLSDEELLSFIHNGFVVVRQLLPVDVLHAGKIAVNARLGRPGGMTDFYGPEDKPALRPPSGFTETAQVLEHISSRHVGRVAPDASHDPMLLACGNCPEVWRVVSQLIGQGKVAPLAGVQVALRFPRSMDALVVSGAAMKYRVAGTSWHTDGLRQGKKHSFSLLVGIALSDEMVAPDNGNLCVWPRSHLHIHHWMRHPDGMIRRAAASPHDGGGGFLDSDGPLPDLGAPVQLLLRAGDVVFVHSEVGHCGGPHLGPDIRTMLYFRVRHVDWKHMCEHGTLVDDMWCDLEGVQHIHDARLLKRGCRHLPAMDACKEVCTLFESREPECCSNNECAAEFSSCSSFSSSSSSPSSSRHRCC